MEDLGHVVLTMARVVAVLAFVLSIVEDLARQSFKPSWYRIGPRVFRATRALPVSTRTELATQHGVFVSVSPNSGMFRHCGSAFTVMPVKGSITWDGSDAVIEGRTSLFIVVSVSAYV